MADMNPDGVLCERCGQPAVGWAFINGKRYCHDGTSPSYYEQTELDMVEAGGLMGMVQELGGWHWEISERRGQ